jgi:uncharacterized membrane protein
MPREKTVNLCTIRKPIIVISGLVFLYDLFFIYNSLFHKRWPTAEKMKELGGTYPIVSFWIGTILILLILIAFQVGLGYLTYKAWAAKSHQSQAV